MQGRFAVLGGFIAQRETIYGSASRELREETELGLLKLSMRQGLELIAVFDYLDRSQRGRTITQAPHFDLVDNRELPEARGGDDAAAVERMLIECLTPIEDCFVDSHFQMLDHFLGLASA
jgi:bifunctional NMN adenylyltransferase/nudix hydrolase